MTIFWLLMAHGHYLMWQAEARHNWGGSLGLFAVDLALLLVNLRFSLSAPSATKDD